MSGIAKVRNKITENALSWEPDYLFWVDDDMMFGNDIVERLLAHKKEFICAEMFSKNVPFMPTMKKIVGVDSFDFNNFIDYPQNSLFEIAGCGMAATLIHRRVFEEVGRDNGLGKVWFEENELKIGESEDMNFCLHARMKGYKIWCDSSVTTSHIGGMGIGRENWLYWKERPGIPVF
jgi:GT2 family glycosyltransferase